MATNDKETIYIDIDDEITGIIDKVRSSSGKIVALVLPKRASVFQSIVNMKLLKRAADDAKKHLVLITTESGLLPLAGAAGVHVAKTLTSRPEIPAGPITAADDSDDTIEEVSSDDPEMTAETAGDRPVGELAAAAGLAAPLSKDGVETIELDDDEAPEDTPAKTAGKAAAAGAAAKAVKKDKKLSVPNFERFRLLLLIGGAALVLLIIGFLVANSVLPKATISIATDATNVNVDTNLTLSTDAKSLRLASNTVPAKAATQQKTYTQQAAATGQKNNGNKAAGSVTINAGSCSGDLPADIPSGTGLSANGQTYVLDDTVSFVPAISGKKCIFQGVDGGGDNRIGITAQSGGSTGNTSGSFKVAGRSDVSASGSASGGTDNVVQVVTASDINNAKSKISTTDTSVKQALVSQLKGEGLYPIQATFNAGSPNATSSAEAGDQASNVTVTETVTYTMFGAKEDDLNNVIKNNMKSQIDTSKQSILTYGLDTAVFNPNNLTATGGEVSMHTTATAGPDLDITTIKAAAAGKKSGEVKDQLQTNPDVTGVTVKLSPFWVSSIPKKTDKITVNIAKPSKTAGQSNASNP